MKKRDYWLMLSLAIVAGLVGGFASHRLFRSEVAFGEKAAERAKVITAEKFVLVDQNGKTRATLGLTDGKSPRLELLDETEAPRAHLGLQPNGAAWLHLHSHNDVSSADLRISEDAGSSLKMYSKSDAGYGGGTALVTFGEQSRLELLAGTKDGLLPISASLMVGRVMGIPVSHMEFYASGSEKRVDLSKDVPSLLLRTEKNAQRIEELTQILRGVDPTRRFPK